MLINWFRNRKTIPIGARRVFRLSFCLSISIAIAYAIAAPLPFLAPIFALVLGLKPSYPLGLKSLTGLLIVVLLTMGVGLLMIPLLLEYPTSAVLVVAVGLYFSIYLTVHAGKALVGTFLTMGFTLISAAGVASFSLATMVIQGIAFAIAISVFCQWLIYPFFPEDSLPQTPPEKHENNNDSNWIAIRATLIILPAYLLALTNPAMYLVIIMKAVSLGQQGSSLHARDAGRELLGSTFAGGCFAILFWFLLDLVTTLWIYSGLLLIFSVYFISKMYQIFPTKFSLSFWQNVLITMLILLGPAVEDTASGSDVYSAFAVRIGLFFAVTLYACLAVYSLESLRFHRLKRKQRSLLLKESIL